MIAVAALMLTAGCGSARNGGDDAGGGDSTDGGGDEAAAAATTWNHQSLTPDTHFPTAVEAQWIDEVNAELEGTLHIEHSPATGMGIQGTEIYTSVGSGVLDCAQMWGGHVAGTQPLAEVMENFGLTPWDIEVRQAAAEAVKPALAEEFEQDGVALLGMVQVEPRNFYTTTEVTSLDQLSGMRLRAAGPGEESVMRALGIDAVVTGDVGETVVGLDQGVYAGLSTSHDSTLSVGWWEHVDYAWETELGGATWYLVCNVDRLNALPDDAQQTIRDLATTYEEQLWGEVEGAHENARAELEDKGMVVHTASQEDQDRMVDLMQPVWDEWADRAGPRGRELRDDIQSVVEDMASP